MKVRHSFVIKDWWSKYNIFKLYVLHGSAARFSGSGVRCYSCFVDNSFLFPTVKEFFRSVNN